MGQMIICVWGISILGRSSRVYAQKKINLIKAVTKIPTSHQWLVRPDSKTNRIKVQFEEREGSAAGLRKKEVIVVVVLANIEPPIGRELREEIFASLKETIKEEFFVDSVKVFILPLEVSIPEILIRYI